MRLMTRTLPAVGCLLTLLATPATAAKSPTSCQDAIMQARRAFASELLELEQRCRDADLRAPGTCPSPPSAAALIVTRALERMRNRFTASLRARLVRGCGEPGAATLAALFFPGRCPDPDPSGGFTSEDLAQCIRTSTERAVGGSCGGGTNRGEACRVVADCPDVGPGTTCRGLLTTTWDPTIVGPLPPGIQRCQRAIAKQSRRFLTTILSAANLCRRRLDACRMTLDGVWDCPAPRPSQCLVLDPATLERVARARTKARDALTRACEPSAAIALRPCEPDQVAATSAADCVLDTYQDAAEEFLAIDLPDPPVAAACGNGVVDPGEECDASADAVCPGRCGSPDGFFPCVCDDGAVQPRLRVVATVTDLDLGWSGQGHDTGLVPGSGYLSDLWDCDGPGGPDTACLVGPSCHLPPHQPCSPGPQATGTAADALCSGAGNFCRTTAAGATGPHCLLAPTRRCRTDADCAGVGDRCVRHLASAPLPLSAGGVAVCVVSTLREDVTGTLDLATGSSAVRLRAEAATFLGGSAQQPCPVCGGFCSGAVSGAGPGTRTLCTSNAECAAGAVCITENLCSFGRDVDRPCRPHPPNGAPTLFFGNPSVDCRVPGAPIGSLDLLFNPLTTSATTLTANQPCGHPEFAGKTCAGGPNQHAVCTVDSECPGGTCNDQCFCPGAGQAPNACGAACLGGSNDADPCIDDADCAAPGFCHRGDCRPNPSDTGSIQEGLCTVGPADGHCTVHEFVPCDGDADCRAPSCPFCDPVETCTLALRQCFVNPTIVREGTPGLGDRTSAAVFCLPGTGSAAVDGVSELPGPGAITQAETWVTTGF